MSQKHSLSLDEVERADALLLKFCKDFQLLYGSGSITPNIHLHAHLKDCIIDYGPMSSFWLFSFERFNGILGDEPTNNRSIEVQLMNRFIQDNAHLQLVNFTPDSADNISTIFSQAVADHVFNLTSKKHLDTEFNSGHIEKVLPASKGHGVMHD